MRYLLMKKDGKMLVSSDFGVHEIESRKDTVIVKQLVPGNILSSDTTVLYPNKLFEDSKGRIWISQPRGRISLWKDGKLKHYEMGERNSTGKSDSHFSFAEDEQGNILIASQPGVLFFYDESMDIIRESSTGRKKKLIEDIKYRGDGVLWVVGSGFQEIRYSNKNRSLARVQNFPYIPLDISKIIELPNGELYFSTPNSGLFKVIKDFAGNLGMSQVLGYDMEAGKEFPFQNIRNAFVAENSDLWLASDNGLGLLQTSFFGKISPSFSSVGATAISQSLDRDIYLSLGEVFHISAEEDNAEPSPIQIQEGVVSSVAADLGRVWVGTAQGEVFYINLYESSSERLDLNERGGSISYMFTDVNSSAWICQKPDYAPMNGVVKATVDEETGKIQMVEYGADKGITNQILVGKQNAQGILFFGGVGKETYLYRYHEKTDAFLNLSVQLPVQGEEPFEVQDLVIDATDNIWLATTYGLFKYRSERMTKIDLGEEYDNIQIRGLTMTADKVLWIATATEGLLRLKDGNVMRFDESSGLPTKIMNYRCLMTDQNQRVWVGTSEGVVISQESNPSPKSTPKPTLLSVLVNGGPIDFKKSKSSKIPNNSSFLVEYQSLAYPGSGITYQTRLRKIKNFGNPPSPASWEDEDAGKEYVLQDVSEMDNETYSKTRFVGKETSFRIEQMPEGKYILEVRAKQKGGYKWSEPMAFEINVDRVWYKKWWAYAIFILLAGGIVWGIIRLNTWRLVREKSKLESIIQARTNELLEKNDMLEMQKKEILEQAESLKEATKEIAEQKSSVEKSYEDMKLLTAIGKNIIMSDDLVKAGQTIGNYLDEIIEYTSFTIGIPNDLKSRLELNIFKKANTIKFYRDYVDYDEQNSLMIWCWHNKNEIIIDDLEKECKNYIADIVLKKDDMNYSQIYLPLEIVDKQLGIMAIQHTTPNQYDENDMTIFKTLGTYVSVMLGRMLEVDMNVKK
ncbi:MAG: ligand-binding sensor domain-containing protein [Flammeovirgaceae bacterium]|jgi:ligand-binding sensor domain-containing protein